MRDHLHGFAQIFTTALFADHRFVDLTSGEIIHLAHPGFNEAFIMAEIKIGFGTVVGNEHFAMLKRTHCARIDVNIRI